MGSCALLRSHQRAGARTPDAPMKIHNTSLADAFLSSSSDEEWYQRVDLIMACSVALYALCAMSIGAYFGQFGLSAGIALPLAALGALLYLTQRGQVINRIVYPVLLMALVAVEIQVSAGRTEFHFGVFVTLALMLGYRHWLPIVVAAGIIALHHVAFNALQAMGFPVYCVSEPSWFTIFLHAGYVVVQSVAEIVILLPMAAQARQAHELGAIVSSMYVDEQLVLDTHRHRPTTPLARQLQDALGHVANALNMVQSMIGQIDVASSEIASGNQDLSTRTEQASSNLQQTAQSVDQITDSMRNNAEAAQNANSLVNSAAGAAVRGGTVVSQVVNTMDEINSSSRKISEITGLIDSIAFQTNILALNAAVEAARAGEQGRGFAVVASEVRSLAQRSATAAKEIRELIGASVEKIDAGARLAQDAGSTMEEIIASVKHVSNTIASIANATHAQSNDVAQVNQAVGQLDQMTQQNAALVQQSAAAAASLRNEAERLTQAMSRFKLSAA